MADKAPKVVLGPGAVCCGGGCDIEGCEPEVVAPAPKELDLTDELAGEDRR